MYTRYTENMSTEQKSIMYECEMLSIKGKCGRRTRLVHEGVALCGSCFGHLITIQAQRAEKLRIEVLQGVKA